MSDASEFSTVELGSLFETVHGGGTPPRNNPDYWNGNIPWASVKDFSDNQFTLEQTEEYITEFGLLNSTSKLIPENIPVICLRMAVGRSALTVKPISINQDLKALFPRKDIDSKYVIYLLQQFRDVIEAKAIGSTVKGVSTKELLRTSIPFPNTIKTQQKIAKILTTIDQLIEKTQALIDKHTAIKQGMMADLFTRGIDPTTGQLRPPIEQALHLYKETELGWIPKDWGENKFIDITDILTCGVAATPEYVDASQGVPFLSAQNVNNGKVKLKRYSHIPISLHQQLTKHSKPQKGDILYSRVGAGFGEAAVVEFDWEFSVYVSLTLIRMKSGYDNYFYKYLLNTQQVKNKASIDVFQGGGVPNLNVKIVRDFLLPTPSHEEQVSISQRILKLDSKIDDELAYLNKLIETKNGLMQDLLTGKVLV